MNRYPLRVEARRDEPLSRWLWLVKWFLLIPHYIVLLFLYIGLVVLTLVAYLAVLFTGRYPHAIATYNLGVLRWGWRVNYYGYQALGTDHYPPFTLADIPDYPARLALDEMPRPRRWQPLVAWLLALPHLLILGALTGAAVWPFADTSNGRATASLGLVTLGILIVGIALLFTGRYPRGLFDLLVGIARWNLRVASYLMLLTPRYPPFRLDQGATEPDDGPPPPPAPATAPAPHSGSVAGSVIALIAGVLLLAPGAGLAIGGGALLALDHARDPSGYATSPSVSLQSSTAAVTAEGITLQAGDLFTRGLSDIGGVRIAVTGSSATNLFVGVARESDVDTWLAGTAHDELTGYSSGAAQYKRADGARRAVAGPAAQDFWLATGTGTGSATVIWKATAGSFAVVVANADGSTGVVADVRAATQIPDLTGLGVGVLIGGVLLALLAIALIVVGGTGLGRRHSVVTPPSGPQLPPPPGSQPGPPAPSAPPIPTLSPR
jgi:uncharacterized protein DUF4389